MKISEAMTHDVWVCLPTEPLSRAAQIMWEQDCGCVPVLTGEGVPVGMLTDRDVCMAALHVGARLDQVSVGQAMSHAPVSCKGSDDVEAALEAMRVHRVRRLPVVDEAGALVGLLSLADVFRAAEAQKTAAARNRLGKSLTETMSRISYRHGEPPAAELTPDEPRASAKKKPAKKKAASGKSAGSKAGKKATAKKAGKQKPAAQDPGAEAQA